MRILSRKESWRLTCWSFQDQLSFLQSETLVFLEAVQQLEFEKWRDAELYDDIKATKTSRRTVFRACGCMTS